MLYDITLRIAYAYDHPADSSRHVIRLAPADISGEQRQVAGTVNVEPKPDEWRVQSDFFGNRTAEFAYFSSHAKTGLSVHSRVERFEVERSLSSSLSFFNVSASTCSGSFTAKLVRVCITALCNGVIWLSASTPGRKLI